MKLLEKRLSLRDSLNLFLVIVFPIHIWSILISFWNFEGVIKRTANLMDGISYLSYALLTALAESLLLFAFLYLLNFLLPKDYDTQKRIVQLGLLAFGFTLWMILKQLHALFEFYNPGASAAFILQFTRPYVATLVGLSLLLVLIVSSIGLPFQIVHRNPRAGKFVQMIFERISPVSSLYLVLDAASIAVILFRNYGGS